MPFIRFLPKSNIEERCTKETCDWSRCCFKHDDDGYKALACQYKHAVVRDVAILGGVIVLLLVAFALYVIAHP